MQGTANHSITRPGAVEKMTGKEGLGALMRSPVSPQMHHIKRFSPLLHVCESKMSPQGESGGGEKEPFSLRAVRHCISYLQHRRSVLCPRIIDARLCAVPSPLPPP